MLKDNIGDWNEQFGIENWNITIISLKYNHLISIQKYLYQYASLHVCTLPILEQFFWTDIMKICIDLHNEIHLSTKIELCPRFHSGLRDRINENWETELEASAWS